MYYTQFKTQFCEIILAGNDEGLKFLQMNTNDGKGLFRVSPDWVRKDAFFSGIVTQINEYFTGSRQTFDVRLAPDGTDFQKSVWKQLQGIPYGETRTYGEIAAAAGNPSAVRAVGGASSRNPVPLIIPCHRVIGAGGKLTGFVYGLKLKKQLLEFEKANLSK